MQPIWPEDGWVIITPSQAIDYDEHFQDELDDLGFVDIDEVEMSAKVSEQVKKYVLTWMGKIETFRFANTDPVD